MTKDWFLPPAARAIRQQQREQEERRAERRTLTTPEELERLRGEGREAGQSYKRPPCKFYVMIRPKEQRARMHRSDCQNCRDIPDKAGLKNGKGGRYWSDAFDSFADADAFMKGLGFSKLGTCMQCRPAPDG